MGADFLELTYVLDDLPSAQHKAGLAGLALLVHSLRNRGKAPLPELLELTPGILRLRVSQQSLQTVFDDLYDATTVEVVVSKKWQGQAPVREIAGTRVDPQTGKTHDARKYVYEQVVPKAQFLRQLGMPDVWIKLWRDAIWSTLRGIPRTRLPFEDRLAKKPTDQASKIWADLCRWRESEGQGRRHSVEVAGAQFLGAQARTAEGVAFQGAANHVLLLHFWPGVTTCWVPEGLRVERAGRDVRTTRVPVGYVLAVPEVADLQDFSLP